MNNSIKKIKILCLHSIEDLEIIQKLEKHLIAANQNIEFYTINNKDIKSNTNKIHDGFDSIHIFLISVSVDFITSKINTCIEMEQIMQLHEERKSTVIPIILSACDWYTFPYALLQSTPKSPITDNRWNSIDDAIMEVVKGIEQVISNKF